MILYIYRICNTCPLFPLSVSVCSRFSCVRVCVHYYDPFGVCVSIEVFQQYLYQYTRFLSLAAAAPIILKLGGVEGFLFFFDLLPPTGFGSGRLPVDQPVPSGRAGAGPPFSSRLRSLVNVEWKTHTVPARRILLFHRTFTSCLTVPDIQYTFCSGRPAACRQIEDEFQCLGWCRRLEGQEPIDSLFNLNKVNC